MEPAESSQGLAPRVVVPYARLYPETKAALEAAGVAAEYVNVAGDPTAYHGLVERLWADGTGWVNVEQDIVVRPGVVEELWACERDWCGFAYGIHMGYGAYLGCTKFSARLCREHPGVVAALDQLPHDGTPRRYWGRLDTRLLQVLEQHEGLRIHTHWPAVGHLNPEQQVPIFNCPRCGGAIADSEVQKGPPPYRCPKCK